MDWAIQFWVFCVTMLIIGTVMWVIQLDKRVASMERNRSPHDRKNRRENA